MTRSKTVRQVALPAEHGGWGFWLEPVLLGILVTPSWAGLWLIVASLAIFLSRQPIKVTLVDMRRGRTYDRTRLAMRFALLYGAIALVGLVVAVSLSGILLLLPLLVVLPLVPIHLAYDARNQSRTWLPEILGPVVMAAFAVSIALAGGWELRPAIILAWIVMARAIPSVVYVRARLLAEKGKPHRVDIPLVTHLIALILAGVLVSLELAPLLVMISPVILLARCAYGLSAYRRPTQAKYIGFQEIGYGLLTVVLAAIGYSIPL